MTREQLIVEARRLRAGIRTHRESSGHALCWHHPALWGLLPEKTDPLPTVPTWPEFLRGCLQYRESLDRQLPDAPGRMRHIGRDRGATAGSASGADRWLASAPYQIVVIDESPPRLVSPRHAAPPDLTHLLHALAPSSAEHRGCGELDGGVEDEWVWMTCTCGAVISQTLELATRQAHLLTQACSPSLSPADS